MRIISLILCFFYIILNSFVYADNPNTSDWTNHADAKADIINNTGHKIGTAYAKQGTKGVLLRLNLNKLPNGIHGMHFHNVGDCSDHQHFQSAGGHIDTKQKPHGFLNPNGPHEGNLPNLIVDNKGRATVELYSDMVSIHHDKNALLDNDGSTLIIHENPDDHISQPIGNAGSRIACGVFKKIND
jgi:superoxide dismutase, Cu-Zn family